MTPTDPYIGKTLAGRYRVKRRIGQGGMGSVYEAEHVTIGRRVAIKVLHATLAGKAEAVERFLREARAATRIGHPNIIEVTDMGSADDGAPFMVLEYLDGIDLSRAMASGLEVERLARILVATCDAVAAAHDQGIIHRDLKPENIHLLVRPGQHDHVKVLDFGISKMHVEGAVTLTQTGAAMGTPHYMSPEQCRGETDPRTDVYALGVIAFQALTGRVPYDHPSFPALVMKIMSDPVPRVADARPDVPVAISFLVERMMAKDPRERPRDCRAVRDALAPFCGADGPPPRVVAIPTAEPYSDPRLRVAPSAFAATVVEDGVAAAGGPAARAVVPTRPSAPAAPTSSAARSGAAKTALGIAIGFGLVVVLALAIGAAAAFLIDPGPAAATREPGAGAGSDRSEPAPAETSPARTGLSAGFTLDSSDSTADSED